MTRNRLKKLESLLAALPCQRCGQRRADRFAAPDIDLDRLSATELTELTALIERTGTRCACGLVAFDLTQATDDELHRALALLRRAMVPTTPLGAALLSLSAPH